MFCVLFKVNTPIFQPTLPKDPQDMDFGNFDIPIFTEEFLDHNKTRDGELRSVDIIILQNVSDLRSQNVRKDRKLSSYKNTHLDKRSEIDVIQQTF